MQEKKYKKIEEKSGFKTGIEPAPSTKQDGHRSTAPRRHIEEKFYLSLPGIYKISYDIHMYAQKAFQRGSLVTLSNQK